MTIDARIYVLTDSDTSANTEPDAKATIYGIADTAAHPGGPYRNELCVKLAEDGPFYTVLFQLHTCSNADYNGKIVHPELGIDHAVSFANGEMTIDGRTYVLDETATTGEVVFKPIMRIRSLVETANGQYYVAAQEVVQTGKSCDYFDGMPLTIVGGFGARGDDLVEHMEYSGHEYIVRGDHRDATRQEATFDGMPAKQLNPEDFEIVFADDLLSVSVTPKK